MDNQPLPAPDPINPNPAGPVPQSPGLEPAGVPAQPQPVQQVPAQPAPVPLPTTAVPPVAPAAPQQSQPPLQPAARQPLFPIIMILVVLIGGSLAGLGGGLALRSYLHASSYRSVVKDFIAAIQQNDKAKADSLESPAAKSFLQKNLGTASFYDACQQEGMLCTASFKASYLAKGTVTYKPYTAQDGAKGKAVIYTIKESLSGAQAGGPGCSSKSTNTVTFDVVPSGSKWLIDNLDENTNASANLCFSSNGSSSTGN